MELLKRGVTYWYLRGGRRMKMMFLTVASIVLVLGAVTLAMTWAPQRKKEIVGTTAEQVRWSAPTYYKDGRQRAQLFGDSSQGGAWIDRVRIPANMRVRAHTHPQDELVTVIEGTWYVGEGEKFDSTKLKAYPPGSFIVIPAGTPHFVATNDGAVVVQLSGNEKFRTDYLEK
jgi:quercetin dioxygenase-like cupin family protein